jgi:predicted RNA-binding Zn-ribbon protein involved in translation (DUF1610 family)
MKYSPEQKVKITCPSCGHQQIVELQLTMGARFLIPKPLRCEAEYTKEMCVMDWRKHYETLKRLAMYFNKPEEE